MKPDTGNAIPEPVVEQDVQFPARFLAAELLGALPVIRFGDAATRGLLVFDPVAQWWLLDAEETEKVLIFKVQTEFVFAAVEVSPKVG